MHATDRNDQTHAPRSLLQYLSERYCTHEDTLRGPCNFNPLAEHVHLGHKYGLSVIELLAVCAWLVDAGYLSPTGSGAYVLRPTCAALAHVWEAT